MAVLRSLDNILLRLWTSYLGYGAASTTARRTLSHNDLPKSAHPSTTKASFHCTTLCSSTHWWGVGVAREREEESEIQHENV